MSWFNKAAPKAVMAAAVMAGALASATTAHADKFLLGIVSISADRGQQRPLHHAAPEGRGRGTRLGGHRSSMPQATPTRPMPPSRTSPSAAPAPSSTWCFRSPRSAPGSMRPRPPSIPVVTWGGGLGGGVAATNGSRRPDGDPGQRADDRRTWAARARVLALTYHTGEVCRNREVVMDKSARQDHPDIKVTKNEVRIPGYFEDGAQYANAWLASHPAGGEQSGDLGLLGRSGDRRHRLAARAGPRRRQGLWRQRQCPGAREHQERLHDGDRLAGQLHRGLQHGQDAAPRSRRPAPAGSRRPSRCRRCW